MILKLLSIQIPDYWETIKYAVIKADEIEDKNIQSYLNQLLNDLLSDKAQCMVRIDSEHKEIIALMVTRFMINKITDQKYLNMQCMYAFKNVSNEEWQKDFDFIRNFAKSENCEYVNFFSRNPKIWKITETIGFKEVNREFRIGG